MKKTVLNVVAASLAVGMMSISPMTFAQEETFHVADFMKMADKNKDGMVTKQEFMDAMGMAYDRAMDKMKKMPAADAKMMMKDNGMTMEGMKKFLKELPSYTGA